MSVQCGKKTRFQPRSLLYYLHSKPNIHVETGTVCVCVCVCSVCVCVFMCVLEQGRFEELRAKTFRAVLFQRQTRRPGEPLIIALSYLGE